MTVEANPETVTPQLAALLRAGGVNRVSLGAQSFRAHLLSVLERRARPDDVRRAVHTLRDAGLDNISLDLIYGIPGQSTSDLERDLADALALEPEHLSCYELEAKPGTRFTHAHGDELVRQAEAMEGYFELVVETLTAAGYRWYETANFCLGPGAADGKDLRARHNLAYWWGRDYLGVGIGAVSTLAGTRRRNLPSLSRFVGALCEGVAPPREVEPLDDETRARERLLLGLRLDEPVALGDVTGAVDFDAAERLAAGGLVELAGDNGRSTIALTRRGRFLGGGVTAEVLRRPDRRAHARAVGAARVRDRQEPPLPSSSRWSFPPANARFCVASSRSTSRPGNRSAPGRSSSGPASACRRRPCGASSPSWSPSAC